ncbi:MAG TPA: gamma-glutamyltransferase [Polyangiaceae bacterium]|nr:gamma-glutamyltransferase [Polyangiaceae bacterium]
MSLRALLRVVPASLLVLALACGGGEQPPAPPGDPIGPPQAQPNPFDEVPALPSASPSGSASAGPASALPAGPPRVAVGKQGAVATQEAHASDVGLAILQKGGNAIDAAVAIGFALAVTHPTAGNVGGGGFMVIRTADDKTFALDYREAAPSGASRDMYLDGSKNPTKESLNGPKAAGVPGTVAGLAAAHKKFGKLGWKDVVAPAIALAKDGFVLDEVEAKEIAGGVAKMKELGFTTAAKTFSKPDGSALAAGDKLVQPELGATLEAISKDPRAFYTGPLAEKMASEVKKAGGIWKTEDLKAYVAKWREPIRFSYRGYDVVTMPPPSAGGIVLKQLLVAAETMHLADKPWRSADEIHLFAEAMRRTYADRNLLLGDPDFVKIPKDLLDAKYIAGRMADIDPNKATPSSQIKAGTPGKQESMQTTHFSVLDGQGNAVSNTYTLNTGFGSKFMIPGTDVLLNNEMDDFSVKPGSPNVFGLVQGEPNKIEPGKRMLSSMTPTILLKDKKVRAVLGSPGGPTISTTVAQLVRALVDYGQPLDVAVPALRAHHQWLPDQIWTENDMPADVQAALEKKGHVIKKRDRIGHANCIEVDPKTGELRAVADTTRGGGKAAAY